MSPTCLPRNGANLSASSTSRPVCTRPTLLRACFAPFCPALLPARFATQAGALPRDKVNKPKQKRTPVNGFIVPNDILERVDRTLIVSVECACYIQSGRMARPEEPREMNRRNAGILLLPLLLLPFMTLKARSQIGRASCRERV